MTCPMNHTWEQVVAENPVHSKVLQQLGQLYHQDSPAFQNQDLVIQYLTKSQEAGEYYYHCILPVLRLPQILWMPKVDIFWVEHSWLVTSPWGCSARLVWVWVHLSWVWGVARSGQGLSGWQVPQCNKTLWCESKAARESKLQFRVTLRREYKAL